MFLSLVKRTDSRYGIPYNWTDLIQDYPSRFQSITFPSMDPESNYCSQLESFREQIKTLCKSIIISDD